MGANTFELLETNEFEPAVFRPVCPPSVVPVCPQTLKLSPQEQLALALGFENLNPPATIAGE
jgi:hypothetical protein